MRVCAASPTGGSSRGRVRVGSASCLTAGTGAGGVAGSSGAPGSPKWRMLGPAAGSVRGRRCAGRSRSASRRTHARGPLPVAVSASWTMRSASPVAVVFPHQRLEVGLRASRTRGIHLGQPFVGLAQQVEPCGQLVGVALRGAHRTVDQIEGVGRELAAARRCGLSDDRGRRGGIAVAAGGDATPERTEGVVNEQRVVHVAARRSDVHDHLRGADPADLFHRSAETLPGGDLAGSGVELFLFGYADRAFDVDPAASRVPDDLDVGLHVVWFRVGCVPAAASGRGAGQSSARRSKEHLTAAAAGSYP